MSVHVHNALWRMKWELVEETENDDWRQRSTNFDKDKDMSAKAKKALSLLVDLRRDLQCCSLGFLVVLTRCKARNLPPPLSLGYRNNNYIDRRQPLYVPVCSCMFRLPEQFLSTTELFVAALKHAARKSLVPVKCVRLRISASWRLVPQSLIIGE